MQIKSTNIFVNISLTALIFIFAAYKIYAQFDIRTITPTPLAEIEEVVKQQPVYKCVLPNELNNKTKVGNIITGSTGSGTGILWYSYVEDGGNITAEELSANLKEIKKQTGLVSVGLKQKLAFIPSEGEACIFTGVSPTIFVYSQNTIVTPKTNILYLEKNPDYIFYEYDGSKIAFERPKEGWIINKKNLKSLSNSIANLLSLNLLEKERLYFELNFSAVDIKSDKLFIGLIPQKEVDTKIPLKVESSNNPKVFRYHFYVSAPIKEKVEKPELRKIIRGEPFILEFGSFIFHSSI